MKQSNKTPEYKLDVLKAAMAIKHLYDSDAISSLAIEFDEDYSEFSEDIQRAYDLAIEHKGKTVFDAIKTKKDMIDIMKNVVYDEENEEKESNDNTDITEDSEKESEEDEFKIKTASAILTITDIIEELLIKTEKLEYENKLLTRSMELIIKIVKEK